MDVVSSAKRQLVCIMFSDILGYTSLMGEDENLALMTLKKNRSIQGPIINKYGGTWIKELGDGVMAMFNSATDAVSAAAEIHLATARESNLKIRIGLHLGEVVFENGDIFGDGVNIAARIEPTAPPGGTHISASVQANLSNKKGIETKPKGDIELKNVKDPIKIYEVIVTDDFESIMHDQKVRADDGLHDIPEKSIAVMSFKNMSADPEQEYFCDGMAEEILIALSTVKDLKVVGRSSAFHFKGSQLSPKEIGKTLKVANMLEGSIRRSGNKVRISAVLINVMDNRQIWAEGYDRELTDIFEVQDDIASKIAMKLKVTFSEIDSRVAPINMEAYEQVLKGRFYVDKYITFFDKALACFTRAIEIDPNYAEAHAELANLYFLYTMNLLKHPKEGFLRAQFYAKKALDINNELSAAHFLLGQLYFWKDWNFAEAKKQYEKASKSAVPFYFTGIIIDPWYYAFGYGDFKKAADSMTIIIENDPLSFFNQYILSWFLTLGKMHEKARKVLNNLLLVAPNFSDAYRLLAYNSFLENDNERAVIEARKAVKLSYGMGWSQITLSLILAQKGDRHEAQQLLTDLENYTDTECISLLGIAIIYINLGNFDRAFEYLEKAMDYRDIWMLSLKHSPEFIPLRNDPRFEELVKRIQYPDQQNLLEHQDAFPDHQV